MWGDNTLPKRALVLGVNGQDGSYLAEVLLARGWDVIGVGRQPGSCWLPEMDRFAYHALDLTDSARFMPFLKEIRPQAIFYFAAVHGSAGFSYEAHWQDVHLVNTVSLHAALEYLRADAPEGVLIYASSSKVFGKNFPEIITELTPRHSSCIYTTTKNAATDLISYYRQQHGIKASVVWTFNHESPRRSDSYFIPRITHILANAIQDKNYVGEIATLGFWSDWGDAEEFMDVVVQIAEKSPSKDFILATGQTFWAADFVENLFAQYGLDWKMHITEKFPLQGDVAAKWRADLSSLSSSISRPPVRTIYAVVDDILKKNYPLVWG